MVILYKIHRSYFKKKYLGFLKVSSAEVIPMSKTGRDLSTHTPKKTNKEQKTVFVLGKMVPPVMFVDM